ncbi:MAG: ABC transporter permease [Nitratireductor sp.]
MNLAYRDVRHNLFRFMLTCLGLSLLMAVVLAMIGIYNGLVADALNIVKAPQADLWVVEAATQGPFAEASKIPGSTRDAVARLHGVTEAGSITYQTVEANHAGDTLRLYVIGFEPGRPGGPRTIARGRGITRTHFELVADRKTGLSVGDRIRLGRDSFAVVGLVEDVMNSAGDPAAFITLSDAQTLQSQLAPPAQRVQTARGAGLLESTDTVAAVIARVEPTADPRDVAQAVRQWKHLGALTQAQQEQILIGSVVDRAKRQIGLFLGILLTVSAVVIALIIYTMTMEKLKQIATLKLIGAPDRTIIGLIVQQSLALGMVGWSFGLILILLIKDYFPRRVVLVPVNAAALAGIIIVVCIAASGLGVRAALKVDPATAIGG